MKFRFIHAADIHLGYAQYNLVERENDFAKAYLAVIEHAIDVRADFVLIAGDLFHRANADAVMLYQARAGLQRLRRTGIPVIAVEGNHDAQHARTHLSWMEYLADSEELLTLLNVTTAANGLRQLAPWEPDSGRGSYVDVAGARIYGMKYYGALTARFLAEVADQVEPGPDGYTLFMMHTGMEGQVPHMHGGLTANDLAPIRDTVDYVALGHVHKRLQLDNWVFNPGSTETNSMDEIEWPHGFFDVRVDTDVRPKHVVTAIETPTLRPFRRITVTTDETDTLSEFVARVEERIDRRRDIPPEAVVELSLGGTASFKRQDVPIDVLTAAVELRFQPLTVRVRNTVVPPGEVTVRHGERMQRSELERQIIEHMVYQQGEYRDQAAAWTRLALDIKNMAVEKSLPADIVDHIQQTLDRLNLPADEDVPEAAARFPEEDTDRASQEPALFSLFEEA